MKASNRFSLIKDRLNLPQFKSAKYTIQAPGPNDQLNAIQDRSILRSTKYNHELKQTNDCGIGLLMRSFKFLQAERLKILNERPQRYFLDLPHFLIVK